MEQTISLRDASAADLDACATFWIAMYEEMGLFKDADFLPGWRLRFSEYFERRIAGGEARISLAVDDTGIIGTAGAMLADGYPAVIHGLNFGYIFGVRVEPAYRGQGLATALTRRSIAFLQQLECRRIRLHASAAGRPIYERIGFVGTNEMELKRRRE